MVSNADSNEGVIIVTKAYDYNMLLHVFVCYSTSLDYYGPHGHPYTRVLL